MAVVQAGRYTMADGAGRCESHALLYFHAVRASGLVGVWHGSKPRVDYALRRRAGVHVLGGDLTVGADDAAPSWARAIRPAVSRDRRGILAGQQPVMLITIVGTK